jgi:hypothetical protein
MKPTFSKKKKKRLRLINKEKLPDDICTNKIIYIYIYIYIKGKIHITPQTTTSVSMSPPKLLKIVNVP